MKTFEILFDVFYLGTIWFFLLKIGNQKKQDTLYLAFLWLAFGDTFHVGLRVVAHLLGDINYVFMNIKLIGFGGMMTAYTVTITYYFFMKSLSKSDQWHIKLYHALILIRLLIISLPMNHWLSEATYGFTIIRNIPLIIIGIIIIYEFLKQNKFYKKFGIYIFFSYLFYLPVIFGVKFVPMLGMLMIPKTMMYLLMFKLYYTHSKLTNSQPLHNVS